MTKRKANHARGETSTPRVEDGPGRRIYEWRTERGMPLHQLSKRSGVAYSLLFALETEEGKRISRVQTAEKLAKAMGVSPAWIVWGDGR